MSLGSPSPSTSDGFVRLISERLGGPVGRHAAREHSWWNPARVALLTATLVYLAGVVFRLPCRITVAGQNPDTFKQMCYSDIGLLYDGRGLLQGNTPYLDSGDYPVLVTSKVLNEGVDVPEAAVGIIVSGSGSVREHVQRLGRILRPQTGKVAVLYEILSAGTAEQYTSDRRRRHAAFGQDAPEEMWE